ncbi:MAG: CsbD family protein [Ktedonobacteraceae bacterium]
MLCSMEEERDDGDPYGYVVSIGIAEEVWKRCRKRDEAPGDTARDQTEGQMRETKGRVKESLGALTGNERLRAEGQRDQTAGASRRKKGQWKERLKAWIDRL